MPLLHRVGRDERHEDVLVRGGVPHGSVAAGEKPVCVEACPARALDFGTAEEMAKMGERGNIAPLPDPSETTPNIFIKASADAQPVGAAEIANPLEDA